MFFHQSQKSIIYPTITINGVDIEKVDHFNFLGLIINKNLKWDSHVNHIASKISRSIGLFMILRHTLPADIFVLLYNYLILHHMTFCLLAWSDHKKKVSLLQKNILRIIAFSKLFPHSEPLLKQLSMIKFNDMVKIQQVKFYYRYLIAKLPSYFLTLIVNQNPHNVILFIIIRIPVIWSIVLFARMSSFGFVLCEYYNFIYSHVLLLSDILIYLNIIIRMISKRPFYTYLSIFSFRWLLSCDLKSMWKSPDFLQLLLFMLFRYMFVQSTSVENLINVSESELGSIAKAVVFYADGQCTLRLTILWKMWG